MSKRILSEDLSYIENTWINFDSADYSVISQAYSLPCNYIDRGLPVFIESHLSDLDQEAAYKKYAENSGIPFISVGCHHYSQSKCSDNVLDVLNRGGVVFNTNHSYKQAKDYKYFERFIHTELIPFFKKEKGLLFIDTFTLIRHEDLEVLLKLPNLKHLIFESNFKFDTNIKNEHFIDYGQLTKLLSSLNIKKIP